MKDKFSLRAIDTRKGVVLDIETTGLDRHRDSITSLQLGWFDIDSGNFKMKFFDWSKLTEAKIQKLMNFLCNCKLVTHNGKFDFLFLLEKTGVELPLWHDTLVMAHVTGHEELGLKALTELYFGVSYDIEKEAKTGKVTQELIDYGLNDIKYTLELYRILRKQLKEKDVEYTYAHEMRAYKAYYKVEQTGVPLSPRRQEIKKELQEEYEPILARLKEVADINWNSNDQVGAVLFSPEGAEIREKPKNVTQWIVYHKTTGKKLSTRFKTKKEATEYLTDKHGKASVKEFGFEKTTQEVSNLLGYGLGLECTQYTGKGKPAVGVDALADYSYHPVVADLLKYKKLTKLETFINSWEDLQVNERIYPSFNITARTGRTTCNNPNLQQVPQKGSVRNLIEAREGYTIISCDYSQAELRVASWFSGDKNMQEAYNSGSDLHQSTKELIYGDKLIDPEVDHDGAKRQRTISKACFSGDTEILTKRGFVRFDNYDGIEEVAQYNVDTKEISYVKPYDFRMILSTPVCSYENENTSLRLTPNHECLIVNTKGNVIKQSFESLAGHGQTKYKWINAGYYQYDKSLFIDDMFTRLLASFVADGSYTSTMTTVRWGFTKKRKADRLKYILEALSIPYKYQKEGSLEADTYYVNDFNTLNLLKRFCGRDKTLSDYALTELNPIVYLEEAQYWDGYVNHTKLIQVSSSNKRTLDIMQIMAIQSGIRARLRKSIDERGNKQASYVLSYNFSKSPYSAFESRSVDIRTHHHATHNVWCVTVPEHNIVIRRNGKVSIQGNCNFGLVYGAMPQTLVSYIKNWGIDLPLEEAQELHKAFFKAYPELKSFYTRCKNFTKRHGYIESPIGRKRWLPDIFSSNWKLKSSAERQCINTPVQGMASDICISALADIVFDETLDHSKFNVLGSVHDAILIECKEEYAEELGEKVVKIMSNPSVLTNAGLKMPVPLKADLVINKSWGD